MHPLIEKGGIPVDPDSTIFLFNGIGPYSLEERIVRFKNRLEELKEASLELTPLKVEYHPEATDILYGDKTVLSINDLDAAAIGLSRKGASEYYLELIKDSLKEEEVGFSNVLFINIGIAILIIVGFIIGLKYYNRIFRLLRLKLQSQKGKFFKGFSVKNYELLTQEKQLLFAGYLLTGIKYALLLFIIYLLLPALFALFPWTQGIASQLIGYVVDPLLTLGQKLIDFIPNMLSIAVIVIVIRYFLRLLSFFRNEVSSGRLVIKGFYPEWSRPTYNILKGVFIALGFVGIWPLLPMSDSKIFQGVSTFFGLMVALGGAGAFSNIIAGLVITYMRSFKIGDRVKIGEV
ncbi:MAG TPA: mechanosensitive ion channel domain-containing protein, partial [Roseivirga sp.]